MSYPGLGAVIGGLIGFALGMVIGCVAARKPAKHSAQPKERLGENEVQDYRSSVIKVQSSQVIEFDLISFSKCFGGFREVQRSI